MAHNEEKIKIKKNKIKSPSKTAFLCTFALPVLILYLVFCIYPVLQSFFVSFFDWNGFSNIMTFIGLDNYKEIFSNTQFLSAIKNDFVITLIKEILIIILAVLFAVSLTRLRFGKAETTFYRFIFYLPNILSVVVIGIVWQFILLPNGIFTEILQKIRLNGLIPTNGWIYDKPISAISFVASWCGIGLFMIILITAINGVPGELYESAKVDGANEWMQLRKITMPAVWNQVKFMIITILYQSLGGNFTLVQVMCGDSVNDKNVVMGLFVYEHSFDSLYPRVSYSYAAALIMLAITAIVSLSLNKILTRESDI